MFFKSSYGVTLTIPQIVAEVVRFINEQPKFAYKVIIGTDSEAIQGRAADFVTAVVVHRVGNGGRYFWRRIEFGAFYTLRDRIIQEVLLSIDVAKLLLAELQAAPVKNWDFEIHADIGANGNTKVLIQEVVGMIRANNFEVRTKPESYAASTVADRHV